MEDRILSMWFFIIFIPLVYAFYNLMKSFDFQKILRKNKIRELKIMMIIVSVGFSYLFAQAFLEVIDRIAKFF